MPSETANRLYDLFIKYGYRWKIGGVLQIPTVDDFDKTIDRAKQELYDEPVPSQMEAGRLIIRHHTQGKFDVYIHIGDIND